MAAIKTCEGVKVDILLSVYNGASFLEPQINSILSQTVTSWRLIVRDDGSSDCSVALIQRYVEKFPDKIFFLQDEERLGALKSFSKLACISSAPYVAFCDQDDVWDARKLEVQLQGMYALEQSRGVHMPLLVYSDLRVVGNQLQPIADSMWRYQRLDATRVSLCNLLIQNTVTGCTLLANRELVQVATPIPSEAVMHDYWFALVAALQDGLKPVPEQLVFYRQHGSNTIGVREYGVAAFLGRAKEIQRPFDLSPHIAQARALYANCSSLMSGGQRMLVQDFIKLGSSGLMRRCYLLLRHGFWMSGWLRNLKLMLWA